MRCWPRESSRWRRSIIGLMYRALGDRVALWVTLNEPWVVTDGGYRQLRVEPVLRQNGLAWCSRLRDPAAYSQGQRPFLYGRDSDRMVSIQGREAERPQPGSPRAKASRPAQGPPYQLTA